MEDKTTYNNKLIGSGKLTNKNFNDLFCKLLDKVVQPEYKDFNDYYAQDFKRRVELAKKINSDTNADTYLRQY